jgi:hypothetical protein
MSRLNELKKQYPELNVTIFDMLTRIDTSKTYKYLPLFCKIFGQKFNTKKNWGDRNDYLTNMMEVQSMLMNKGISTDGLTDSQMYYIAHYIAEHFSLDTYTTLREFMDYMDKGQIENKDVSTYQNLDDLRGAVTLASMKELNKELEGQIIKEFEDEKWVALRPLTFASSVKYGASTRWCTTYQKEKQYFEKYWRRGILVYFINKLTGYKFAGFKGLDGDAEFSFWNAEDSRTDYLELDVDDYLFPIVRKIFKSQSTNKNLSSNEIQEQVHNECLTAHEKMRVEFVQEPMVDQTVPANYEREVNTIRELLEEMEIPQVYPPNQERPMTMAAEPQPLITQLEYNLRRDRMAEELTPTQRA